MQLTRDWVNGLIPHVSFITKESHQDFVVIITVCKRNVIIRRVVLIPRRLRCRGFVKELVIFNLNYLPRKKKDG